MRNLGGSPGATLPAHHPLALILAGLAPPVWVVAGLTLGLTLLVLALSAPLSLALTPRVLACRSWRDWRWGWLCRPDWFLEPEFWLYRSWLRWPWLCRSWLR